MLTRWFAGLAILLLTASCTSPGGLRVEMDEYTLDPARSRVSAGEVTFSSHNSGSIAHQFLVLRTDLEADDLPEKKGLVQIDDKRVEQVGEIGLVPPGETESLTLELPVGRYALICNIVGHYDNGMHAPFEASPGAS